MGGQVCECDWALRSGARECRLPNTGAGDNTACGWFHGTMVGETGQFLKPSELIILLGYGAATKFTNCGFEKILPSDATVDERVRDSSPSRRKVKGKILANGASSRSRHASQPRPGRVIWSGRTSRSKSSADTKPSRIASSRSVVPFACAALAIAAARS